MAEVASPKATGGAGPAFEFKVQAAFLATMLVEGRHPCLPDGTAGTIRFQSRPLGYHTDDVFLQLTAASGSLHRLLVQAKSNMAFTEGDSDFCASLTGAWDDFSNSTLFTPACDSLLFITGPGSKKEIEHFRPLLSWSRTSVSAEDYFKKVATPKAVSRDTCQYLATVKAILTNHLGAVPSDERLWEFLKLLHWHTLDFDMPDSQDLARVLSMLRLGMKPDARETPDAIWGQLLKIAVDYDPEGGALTMETLRSTFGECVITTRVSGSPGVERLREHAEGILAVVQTGFPDGTHLDRQWLLREMWDILMQSRQLIVAGVAGAGKSAAIKDVVSLFARDIPTFVLKADELDRPHLHQALNEIGVSESLQELSSRFGLLESKLLIVDSLEKLLEADCWDAFQQLLQFVLSDPTWLIVMSCRSHALGLVQNEILVGHGISQSVIQIPLLADYELQRVVDKHPGIEKLLANASLKDLLRVPMYCSYACRIDWKTAAIASGSPDVQEFRRLLWKQVILRETHQREGMHLKRERCFTQVAIARAKRMTPFAPIDGLDVDALQKLEADGLIVRTSEGVTPAHDLFEEWAIDQHIDSLYQQHQTDRTALFAAIGSEPAMRRGFRAWLVDNLARPHASEFAAFITLAAQDQRLPSFWRDEVLVAILLSSQAEQYFATQETPLLAADMQYLCRIIHLLRTACKEPDAEKLAAMPLTEKGREFLATMFLRPAGSGWAAVMKFLAEHLAVVPPKHLPLILGFLQDWLGVLGGPGLPKEARMAGLIALNLLNQTRNTFGDEMRTEIVRVALRVSGVLKEELHALFAEALAVPVDEEEDDYGFASITARKMNRDVYRFCKCLVDSAVETFHCASLCESMPDDVVALAKRKWMPQPAAGSHGSSRHIEVEQYFGLEKEYGFNVYPASALRGPFLFLLKHHPAKGMDLILGLINSAIERYAMSGLDTPHGETLQQVAVQLNDSRKIQQYLDWRLWGAFRGLTVIPEILQSALMALEKWLFDLADTGQDITAHVNHLLAQSNSCAVSAVLASVAMKYPTKVGESVFPLLRTREFFHLDLARMIGEPQLAVNIAETMGIPESAEAKIHSGEREDSRKSTHRKMHLEDLAFKLQFGTFRVSVQGIIDDHLASLPPLANQDDADRVWRLALHRMDLRKYKAEEAGGGEVLLTSAAPDPDIQQMQALSLPSVERVQKRGYVSLWARQQFWKGSDAKPPFATWKEAIQWAKETLAAVETDEAGEDSRLWVSGPVHIVALSIRDHVAELDDTEFAWCAQQLVSRLSQVLDADPTLINFENRNFDGTAACAVVVTLLLDRMTGAVSEDDIRLVIAASLTCPDKDVRGAAIQGAHKYLWPRHSTLARSCLAGMLRLGKMEKQQQAEVRNLHRRMLHPEFKDNLAVGSKYGNLLKDLRTTMAQEKLDGAVNPSAVKLDDWSAFSLVSVVQMLPFDKALYDWEPLFVAILKAVLEAEEQNESRTRDWGTRLFALKMNVANTGAYFALLSDLDTAKRICEPVASCVDKCPDYVADFVEDLINRAESATTAAHFWSVWHLFADVALEPARFKTKHLWVHDEKLIRTLLLGETPWNPDVKEWKILSGHPADLEAACKVACRVSAGFDATLRLLYSVGSFYLPKAFTWLSDALPNVEAVALLTEKNNRYILESLLQREIQLRSADIRGNPQWQKSVLLLLDALVDCGSSVAFQLRERMIRPPRTR